MNLGQHRSWQDVLAFLSRSFGGGTDLETPLAASARRLQGEWRSADILLVTDGEVGALQSAFNHPEPTLFCRVPITSMYLPGPVAPKACPEFLYPKVSCHTCHRSIKVLRVSLQNVYVTSAMSVYMHIYIYMLPPQRSTKLALGVPIRQPCREINEH